MYESSEFSLGNHAAAIRSQMDLERSDNEEWVRKQSLFGQFKGGVRRIQSKAAEVFGTMWV